jgi:hypothetical protein
MKRKFLYGLFYLAVFLLLSLALMFLWNRLLPPILNVTAINYWQALGLMVLCRILFGNFRFGWFMGMRGDSPRHLLKDKLIGMSEEDRAAFKEEWRKRCEGRR